MVGFGETKERGVQAAHRSATCAPPQAGQGRRARSACLDALAQAPDDCIRLLCERNDHQKLSQTALLC
jgi:hypothetical protein